MTLHRAIEEYGSALVPDFQEHYGLRLVEVAREWEPAEVVLLIAGLPGRSRYARRLMGEKTGVGWDEQDWLMFDVRNALEAIRAMLVAMGDKKKKNDFREWDNYPGKQQQKRKKAAAKLDKFRLLAGKGGLSPWR